MKVSSDSARVNARVRLWFKTAQFWWQDPQSRPAATNIIDLQLRLSRADGNWKIVEESRQFARGGGP
jgi:hypothetical protein